MIAKITTYSDMALPSKKFDVATLAECFDNEVLSKACHILEVIDRYRHQSLRTGEDRSDEGKLKFLSIIYSKVRSNKPVELVLPAFPFKSPNRRSKVLGSLPDKGEEYALAHLDGLCAAISDIYKGGAVLTIASDGLVYNDLLGVPDSEVWSYGQALRAMVTKHNFQHIKFVRLSDLLAWTDDVQIDAKVYAQQASTFRSSLLQNYTPMEFNVNDNIASDENVCATYRGYIKFLSKDLAHTMADVPEGQLSETKSQFKRRCEKIAKQMISRGAAFAKAIAKSFPDHVRLSIHPSDGSKKMSIALLPSISPVATTPWHSTPCFKVDGRMITDHKEKFDGSADVELVYNKDGQPWFYREKSDLFVQSSRASYEPIYPCGYMVEPIETSHPCHACGTLLKPSIKDVDMLKIRALAQQNSPIVLRGFADTKDKDLYLKKAHEMGKPVGWKFGLILEVEDRGADTAGLNNVLSSEWMPFHYDGLFKIVKRTDERGIEENVSMPPKLQYFTAMTPSPKGTGYTLFTPSHLLLSQLPPHLPLSRLESLSWTVKTPSFDSATLPRLPLITPHPVTGQPCLRYHEPWPQSKTQFDPTEVQINDVTPEESRQICDVLDSLLHDRRLCYYHAWEDGDALISDNVLMMHTRSSFEGNAKRSLRRIHVD